MSSIKTFDAKNHSPKAVDPLAPWMFRKKGAKGEAKTPVFSEKLADAPQERIESIASSILEEIPTAPLPIPEVISQIIPGNEEVGLMAGGALEIHREISHITPSIGPSELPLNFSRKLYSHITARSLTYFALLVLAVAFIGYLWHSWKSRKHILPKDPVLLVEEKPCIVIEEPKPVLGIEEPKAPSEIEKPAQPSFSKADAASGILSIALIGYFCQSIWSRFQWFKEGARQPRNTQPAQSNNNATPPGPAGIQPTQASHGVVQTAPSTNAQPAQSNQSAAPPGPDGIQPTQASHGVVQTAPLTNAQPAQSNDSAVQTEPPRIQPAQFNHSAAQTDWLENALPPQFNGVAEAEWFRNAQRMLPDEVRTRPPLVHCVAQTDSLSRGVSFGPATPIPLHRAQSSGSVPAVGSDFRTPRRSQSARSPRTFLSNATPLRFSRSGTQSSPSGSPNVTLYRTPIVASRYLNISETDTTIPGYSKIIGPEARKYLKSPLVPDASRYGMIELADKSIYIKNGKIDKFLQDFWRIQSFTEGARLGSLNTSG